MREDDYFSMMHNRKRYCDTMANGFYKNRNEPKSVAEDLNYPLTRKRHLYYDNDLQNGLGMDCYDYGFRMYDAQLGRFHAHDPLTDFLPGITPYSYALNNPVNYIDFEGLWPWDKKKREARRKARKKNRKQSMDYIVYGPKPNKKRKKRRRSSSKPSITPSPPADDLPRVIPITIDIEDIAEEFFPEIPDPIYEPTIIEPLTQPLPVVHGVPAEAGEVININHTPFRNYGTYYLTPVRTADFLRPIANALRQNRNLIVTIYVRSGSPGDQRCTIYTGAEGWQFRNGTVNDMLRDRGDLIRQTLINNGVQRSQIRVAPWPNEQRMPANRITIIFGDR